MRLRAWLVQGRAVLMASVAIVAVVGTGLLTACGGGGGKESSSEKKSEQGTVSGKSGKLTDKRDGQKYRTVKIGNQTWMAENLNHQTGKSWCYGNDDSNCKQYGRLYDWETAKTACPSGWHLPTKAEWSALVETAGDDAGRKFKSKTGWDKGGTGTDDYGFSALPGGAPISVGNVVFAGYGGYYWTATEGGASRAYTRRITYDDDNVDEDTLNKEDGFAVRCVGD
jgi:uncharacterized protein (TIGR02145 family)